MVSGSIIKAPCKYARRLIITFTWPADNASRENTEGRAGTRVLHACYSSSSPSSPLSRRVYIRVDG